MFFGLDEKWRKECDEKRFVDDFASVAYRLYRRVIPTAYVENYNLLSKASHNIYGKADNARRVYFSCEQIEGDELFKLYLKRIQDKRSDLYCIQHGGGYGMEKNMVTYHEFTNCNTYITWGWTAKNLYGCSYKSMPSPKLLSQNKLKSQENGQFVEVRDILYVSYTLPRNLSRLRCIEARYEDDRELELDFLKSLPVNIANRIIARNYMFDYGWDVSYKMESANQYIKVDNKLPYYEMIKNAKLIICYTWSTTAIEALFENIPVVIRRGDEDIEPFAMEYYNAMVNVGIVFKSFDELLMSLPDIIKDIDAWWNDLERKKVVEIIRRAHAYLPENAEKLWIEEMIDACKS